MKIERFHDLQGNLLAGFFVRNRIGKLVAIGANPKSGNGFVTPSHKCYARDVDLCRALGTLTGQPVKWNLVFYGNHLSSHNRQDLMRKIRQTRRPS